MDTAIQLATVDLLKIKESDSLPNLIISYLYYAENIGDYSPDTLKSRRIYLKQFCEYWEKDITELTNIDLDIYWIAQSKRISHHTGRQITTGTINTSKRAVKAFLKWCKEYHSIPLKVRLGHIKEKKLEDTNPKILSDEDILFVIENAVNEQDRLVISVMYYAGLRISEIANMKLEDLRGRTLDVVGKGKKHRITYVTPKLQRNLLNWTESNRWDDGYIFRPLQHGRLGVGYKGTGTLRDRVEKVFWDLLGISMHPHQLRHAFALRLLKSGVDLRSIQKLLGHAKIETTMIYLDITDDYLEKQYSRSFS